MPTWRQTGLNLALAFVVATGFFIVWVVAASLPLYSRTSTRYMDEDRDSLIVLDDGTAAIQHSGRRGKTLTVTLTTLSGETLHRSFENVLSFSYLRGEVPRSVEPFSNFWSGRLRVIADNRAPRNDWTLVFDGQPEGHAYFVGYDSSTNERIGFIGPRGFSVEELPPEQQFPVSREEWRLNGLVEGGSPNLRIAFPRNATATYIGETALLAGGKFYIIDLDARTAVVPFQSRRPFRSINRTFANKMSRIVLLSDDQLFTLEDESKPPEIIDLPQQLRGKDFHWSPTAAGGGIAYTSEFFDENAEMQEETYAYQIFWLAAKGVSRTANVVLRSTASPTPNWVMAVLVPCPAAMVFLLTSSPVRLRTAGGLESVGDAKLREIMKSWPAIAAVHLLALVLSIVCYRHEARLATPLAQRVAWAVFVFVFGLPGLVGYWTHRKWPLRAACPQCGKVVPRDREFCVSCRQEFPLPERRGIEIFA